MSIRFSVFYFCILFLFTHFLYAKEIDSSDLVIYSDLEAFKIASFSAREYYDRYNSMVSVSVLESRSALSQLCHSDVASNTLLMTAGDLSPAVIQQVCGKKRHTVAKLTIAHDAIVLVSTSSLSPTLFERLTSAHIYEALIDRIPQDKSSFVKNHSQYWRDIFFYLPQLPIKIYGPAADTAFFNEIVRQIIMPSAYDLFLVKKLCRKSAKKCQKYLRTWRSDGAYFPLKRSFVVLRDQLSQENYTVLLTSYSTYLKFSVFLKPLKINNYFPNIETIRSGEYPFKVPINIYIQSNPNSKTKRFLKFLLSDYIKTDGDFDNLGLIPLERGEYVRLCDEWLKLLGNNKGS